MPLHIEMLPNEWIVERSLAAVQDEWRAFQQKAVGTPFQTVEWIANLLEDPAETQNAVFVLGRRDGQTRIAFALTLERGTIRWLGDAWNNYNLPLVSSELFEALDAPGVDRIWEDVRTALGHPAASILRRQPTYVNGRPNPFSAWSMVREPTDAYALNLGSDWKSFYSVLSSPSTQRTLKRKKRNLEGDGAAAMLRVEEPADIHRHIMLMLQWKSDQVDAAGRRNMLSDIESREIFARFGERYPDRVRVYAIHLDGRPISIMLLFEARGSLVLYQMAYEENAVARRSPGRLLLNYVLEQMIIDGYAILDFSVGDDIYKRDMCDIRIAMTNSMALHSAAGVPAFLRARLGTQLKKTIKARPALLNALRRVNALLHGGSLRRASS